MQGNWWNYYFVRYLLGTSFAVLCLVWLIGNPSSKLFQKDIVPLALASTLSGGGLAVPSPLAASGSTSVDMDKAPSKPKRDRRGRLIIQSTVQVTDGAHGLSTPEQASESGGKPGGSTTKEFYFGLIFIGLAFGYCYFSSAPVLVLHATRASFAGQKSLPRILVFVFVLFAFSVLEFPLDYSVCASLGIVFVGQIYLIVRAYIYDSGKLTLNYYKDLIHWRGKLAADLGEAKDTYKHLREHGNAFFILIFEVYLCAVFSKIGINQYFGLIVILWVLPAAYIYIVGQQLEDRFVGMIEPEVAKQDTPKENVSNEPPNLT